MLIPESMKRIMHKNNCTKQDARKIRKEQDLLKIMKKHSCDIVEAKSIWSNQNNKAGIDNEITLARLLRQWGLSARRIPRSGAKKKEPKRATNEPKKPADIKVSLVEFEFLIEAKLRADCRGVYDAVHEVPECHKVKYREVEYFFVSQESFRRFVVDRTAPMIIENPKKDVKFYFDLFRETAEKERSIDVIALKQRYKKQVFIVRPNTMQKLLNRCELHET